MGNAQYPVQASSTLSHLHLARKSGRRRPEYGVSTLIGRAKKTSCFTNFVLQKFSNKSRQTSIPSQKMSLRKLPSSVLSGENGKYAMMNFQE